jgi:hypothetical protein
MRRLAMMRTDQAPGQRLSPRDFDGQTDLRALVRHAALEGPSRTQILPHLHAIATTHVCINLAAPREHVYEQLLPNRTRWNNGIWHSHRLFRAHGNSTRVGFRASRAGDEPCGKLTAIARADARKPPHRGSKASGHQHPARLIGKDMASEHARRSSPLEYVVRRKLAGRQGSIVEFGELQGNVDPNRFHCPERLDVPGVTHWSCGNRPPYLGAFSPAFREWCGERQGREPIHACLLSCFTDLTTLSADCPQT